MRIVTSTEVLYWKNRFSEKPALWAAVDPSWAAQLGGKALPPGLGAVLADRFTDFPAGGLVSGPLQFAAALCAALHMERYGGAEEFGTGTAAEPGFWFSVRDPVHARVLAPEVASFVAWTVELATGDSEEIARTLEKLIERTEPVALDQTIRAMLAECDRRGIPWRRLDSTLRAVRLGQGASQAWQLESLTGVDSALGGRLAKDKAASFRLLADVALPVGRFALAGSADRAVTLAGSFVGYPLVAKPNTGGKGRSVFVGLSGPDQVRKAADQILAQGIPVLLQSVIPGDDHRLLVVDGRLIAVARRNPAAVVGDGVNSVETLVRNENRNPNRGSGFRKLMNFISLDVEVDRVLAGQGLNLASVPAAGRRVLLRRTANISTGGTATDFTGTIHPDNRRLAERAARALGLKVAGVDFLTPDITRSWREVGGGICEVNTTVGLRPHWLANPKQNVVAPILDLVYPSGSASRIPIALVTGSNGKTTTTRMIGSILKAAGHTVGMATTDGVQVDGEWLTEGDVAGARGAALVLQEPTVTAAALETARGGVLKRGIYLEQCGVAALLNVQLEQVGIDGIDTLEEMAALKRKVLETARSGVVLNAGDALCREMAGTFPIEKTVLFSPDPQLPALAGHLEAGGRVVTLETDTLGAEKIVLRQSRGATETVMDVTDAPATLDGRVRHNVHNALAATALGWAIGIEPQVIAEGLRSFHADVANAPGRFNFLERFPVDVMLDYAHNPPGLREAVASLDRFPRNGRRLFVLSSPGNRPDDQLRDMGRVAAPHADLFVCMERLDRRRGRAEGEIARLIAEGLVGSGVPRERIHAGLNQEDAVKLGISLADQPGDLLAIFYTEFKLVLRQLEAAFAELGAAQSAPEAGSLRPVERARALG
jgi:cyanophycin synthetase